MRTAHFIFMSSSYSLGTRIALDYIFEGEVTQKILKQHLDKIKKECGEDVSISTHLIQAENKSWDSVCSTDHFFKDVKVINSLNEFINLIKKDRTLLGADVAKYILSKISCTHLKLEKLVYLCFADYLCDTQKDLFNEKIYAFQYGPVIDSVFKTYRKYKYESIKKDSKDIECTSKLELPSKSRILFAEDGLEKIISIDKTLEKYCKLSASDLVRLTHKPETPWTKTYISYHLIPRHWQVIRKDIILQYHKNEETL